MTVVGRGTADFYTWTWTWTCVCYCCCCRAGLQRYTWRHITAVKMSLGCSLTAELMSTSWLRSSRYVKSVSQRTIA